MRAAAEALIGIELCFAPATLVDEAASDAMLVLDGSLALQFGGIAGIDGGARDVRPYSFSVLRGLQRSTFALRRPSLRRFRNTS